MMMSSRRSKSLNLRKRSNANKAVQQENWTFTHTLSTAQYVFKNEETGCICFVVTNRGKEARNTAVIGPEGTA